MTFGNPTILTGFRKCFFYFSEIASNFFSFLSLDYMLCYQGCKLHVNWSQFYQHFTRAYITYKSNLSSFSLLRFGFVIFCPQNICAKCWWNWHLNTSTAGCTDKICLHLVVIRSTTTPTTSIFLIILNHLTNFILIYYSFDITFH